MRETGQNIGSLPRKSCGLTGMQGDSGNFALNSSLVCIENGLHSLHICSVYNTGKEGNATFATMGS